ncbi:hypothetical protein [Shewanella waksmanii]|uniref:hypothetical protein n=1 Tax=Shewanella waksmanii TaxID=213783 RepID=UPI00049026DC|nr:hypothetical protein [Shewanella waksmanii]
MDDLKEKIIKATKDGTFFELIGEEYYQDHKNDKLLPSILSKLHNEGIFDLVQIFRSLENSQERHDFFSVRQIFGDILPKINAPVKSVADSVKHLTLEAGIDGAAYWILGPFQEFCKKDSKRPKQLLDISLTDIDENFDHLSVALISGAQLNESLYAKKAIDLVTHSNELVRQRATFALGRIQYIDQILAKDAVLTIKQASKNNSSDLLLATSMNALFSLVLQEPSLECHFVEVLEDQKDFFGERYVHTSAEILFREGGKITEGVESYLLDICCHTKPENKDTIDKIDYALARLVKSGKFDTCVSFLEKFFSKSSYEAPVKHFDSFIREIHQHKETYLSSLVTRWLLSKNVKLGKYCTHLLKGSDEGICLSFDKTYLTNQEKGVYLFLARKACGWFFVQPKTAISLIESLLDDAPDEELKDIQHLVFNPLLISYPGSIYKHLEGLRISKNAKALRLAEDVLVQFGSYQKALKAASGIHELRPSEQDRHTYWKHHQRIMDASMKQARSKSIFSSLFFGNESVLLYGNKFIHYIHHGDEKNRQEIPLQELSHSVEIASMHNLDPHSLENMIRQFRVEGCHS